MTPNYKVKYFMDDNYEVLELVKEGDVFDLCSEDEYESVFQGSLADCEAYIRLHENGYM